YLSGRANLSDPDERMRLARWCQLHGLRKQGLAEAWAALALRPGDGEAWRLERILQRAVAAPTPTPAAASKPGPAALALVPSVDLSTESMSRFATHVQPILMNACASCHANNRGGSFHLLRSYNAGPNQRATQYNMAAVIAQVDKQRPVMSPLLI